MCSLHLRLSIVQQALRHLVGGVIPFRIVSHMRENKSTRQPTRVMDHAVCMYTL